MKNFNLIRHEKKLCWLRSNPFNNCVKYNNLYPLIRIVFISNNLIVSNFNSTSHSDERERLRLKENASVLSGKKRKKKSLQGTCLCYRFCNKHLPSSHHPIFFCLVSHSTSNHIQRLMLQSVPYRTWSYQILTALATVTIENDWD